MADQPSRRPIHFCAKLTLNNDNMQVNRRPVIYPTPAGVCAYFDLVQLWLPEALPSTTIAQLRGWCGSIFYADKYGPARFDSRLRYRLELKQPADAALRLLAQRPEILINRIELALDLNFQDPADRDDAGDFFHRHLIRPWHGRKQKVRIYKPGSQGGLFEATEELTGTRYDSGRWAANQIVLYKQNHCRITGEADCLHLEWRLNRLKAVRAAGIESGGDLPNFNHRAFWQKRLQLRDVDRRRLGRLVRNRTNGTKRRTCEIERSGQYTVNLDGRTGDVLVRSFYTVQELIDHLKGNHRVHRALVTIPTDALLPD
jgi:hypothetical protein